MDGVTAPAALQRIAAAIEAGAVLTSAERAAVAVALRGLVQPSERYSLIREAVATLLSQDRRPAKAFAQRLADYAAGAWKRERDLPECPPRRSGKLEGYFFHILKIRDRTLTERQLRRILDLDI